MISPSVLITLSHVRKIYAPDHVHAMSTQTNVPIRGRHIVAPLPACINPWPIPLHSSYTIIPSSHSTLGSMTFWADTMSLKSHKVINQNCGYTILQGGRGELELVGDESELPVQETLKTWAPYEQYTTRSTLKSSAFCPKGIYRVSASFLRQAPVAFTPEYITAASTQPTVIIQYGGFIVRLRYCTGALRNAVVSMCTVWFKTRCPLFIVCLNMTVFSHWKCESASPSRNRCGTMGR